MVRYLSCSLMAYWIFFVFLNPLNQIPTSSLGNKIMGNDTNISHSQTHVHFPFPPNKQGNKFPFTTTFSTKQTHFYSKLSISMSLFVCQVSYMMLVSVGEIVNLITIQLSSALIFYKHEHQYYDSAPQYPLSLIT